LGTMRNAGVLLQLLSEGPLQVTFTELSERSGLSPSTAHRLLRSLVLAGLVQQDPRTSRYSLGLHVVRLSESYLARQPVLRALERTEPAGAVESAVPVRDRSGRVVAAQSALAEAKTLPDDVHAERASVLTRAAKAAGQAVGDV